MNRLTCRSSRLAGGLAALALALLATACGPGVGGSGTGAVPDPVAAQGAAPAALCESALATALGCAPPAASPTSAPVLASPLVLADADGSSGASRRVQAVIGGEELLFNGSCPPLHFEGRWGRGPDGLLRFYGRLADGRLASATLQLDASGWLLSLHDTEGLRLFGPQRLLRVDGIATLQPCG